MLQKVQFSPIESIRGKQTVDTAWWLYWLLIGIGFLLGWFFRRPVHPKIRRWNTKASTFPEQQVYIVDEEEELVQMVERIARQKLVLLCTHPDRWNIFSDIANQHSIFLMNNDVSCEHHSLLNQLSILENLGDAMLILDGTNGLVKPLPSESAAGVINEILCESAQRVCVVFMRSDVPDGVEISDPSHEPATSQ